MIHDGSPAWTAERALDSAYFNKVTDGDLRQAHQELVAANLPAPPEWFGVRLSVVWTLFMAGRDTDEDKFAVWLGEMARLLGDIPHDIVAHAIDEAIRKAPHGFAPSVGEIRKHADPLVAERTRQIERLERIEAALSDPQATAERERRWFEIEARERDIAARESAQDD